MVEIANHAGNEVWPSLPAASRWFDRASVVLAISLAFSFGATVVIVWLGIVKEHHWDLLRDASNEKVATLELEAARANAELGKANAEIANAKKAIAVADERTAALAKDAENARADIARATAEAAKANEETAKARVEQERLKGQLAWRRLTKEQSDLLAINARKFSQMNPPPISLSYPAGDPEAAVYANEITAALKQGGLILAGPYASIWTPTPPFGLIFKQKGSERVAHPFAELLVASGFNVTLETDSPGYDLIVGSKPAPF